MSIFNKLFKSKKKIESFEINHLNNSNVFILQTASTTDLKDISSLFNNNPYSDIIIEDSNSYNGSLTILSKNISYRNKTINDIKETWRDKTWLNIYGGYDTGKSHLSLLISNYLRYPSLNFSFKDLSSDEFKKIVVLITKQIISYDFSKITDPLIIFDDIPQLGFDDNLNILLIQIFNHCNSNNIKILSTSNYKINRKITDPIKDNFKELQVPLLNKEEIEEIILTYIDDKSKTSYSTIIEAISLGYPIYVQIICKYLESVNWSLSDNQFAFFISGKAFNEFDDDIYQKLLYTTQNESAREILYRLNIISGTISNEIIEIVSNVNPKIMFPFEKINSLSGTWLQKNSDETYFVSPLIKRLGSTNLLPETKKEINNKLAQNILSKKNISQYDAQTAITHFLQGESFDEAGMLMAMGLQSYFHHPEIFIETLFSKLWTSTYLPEKMSPSLKLSIRILQLHIIVDLEFRKHKKFNKKNKIFIREDLENLIKLKNIYPSELINLSNLILFKSYVEDDIIYSLDSLIKLSENSIGKSKDLGKNLYDNLWLTLDKISNQKEIQKWFESFERIKKDEEFYDEKIIHIFSRRLFDNILESKKKWDEILEILDFIVDKSILNGLEILSSYSAKTKIFILVEKLDNLSKAEIYFNEVISFFKNPKAIFLVKDELGRQQYYKDRKDEALLNLLEVEEVEILTILKIDNLLTIAKIVGENDKNLAHNYTKKALDFLENKLKTSKLSNSKLIGEYAISFWLLGDSKTAIYKIADCYELLLNSYEEIDDFNNVDDYNIVVLRIGVSLNYIYHILNFGKPPSSAHNGGEYFAPVRGMFNGNYDSKLLNEWYYDERKYMNCFLLIQSFEFFNDKDNSIKWANISFELNKKINLITFKNTLRSFVVYKILQNKFEEVLEIEEELNKYESSLTLEMADTIKNSQQKSMFLDLLNKLPATRDMNYHYLKYNLVPYLLLELTLFLENKNNKDILVNNLKKILINNNSLFSDKNALEYILHILENFPDDYNSSKELIAWVNQIETENKKIIQVICYLICSLKVPTDEARKLHLALMPYLEREIKSFSKGIFLFILYPFVQKFWTSRILTNPQEFYYNEHWQKNLIMSLNTKNELKVLSIYSLICIHLSYAPNENEQNWMQPYINYKIKHKY